eukprot:1118066-Prymnesium_polylepis.1
MCPCAVVPGWRKARRPASVAGRSSAEVAAKSDAWREDGAHLVARRAQVMVDDRGVAAATREHLAVPRERAHALCVALHCAHELRLLRVVDLQLVGREADGHRARAGEPRERGHVRVVLGRHQLGDGARRRVPAVDCAAGAGERKMRWWARRPCGWRPSVASCRTVVALVANVRARSDARECRVCSCSSGSALFVSCCARGLTRLVERDADDILGAPVEQVEVVVVLEIRRVEDAVGARLRGLRFGRALVAVGRVEAAQALLLLLGAAAAADGEHLVRRRLPEMRRQRALVLLLGGRLPPRGGTHVPAEYEHGTAVEWNRAGATASKSTLWRRSDGEPSSNEEMPLSTSRRAGMKRSLVHESVESGLARLRAFTAVAQAWRASAVSVGLSGRAAPTDGRASCWCAL